ncbi:hypothetical protein GCM10022256_06560 [Frondihabitans peucedani]|uniref:Uncharacterized protein n=1 Tax=Frondihabitans peucedani TaxID=598626 RepID=A0ABP8DZA9_9MICO
MRALVSPSVPVPYWASVVAPRTRPAVRDVAPRATTGLDSRDAAPRALGRVWVRPVAAARPREPRVFSSCAVGVAVGVGVCFGVCFEGGGVGDLISDAGAP